MASPLSMLLSLFGIHRSAEQIGRLVVETRERVENLAESLRRLSQADK